MSTNANVIYNINDENIEIIVIKNLNKINKERIINYKIRYELSKDIKLLNKLNDIISIQNYKKII